MKKVLGLDLGVNSIGWALVNESEKPEEQSSIIKAGVRITPISIDEFNEFTQGKSISLNAQRRMARSARRNLQRFKLRRVALASLLRKNGIISKDVKLYECGNSTTFETYRLRAKAVSEALTLEEFARVLMMINKKRGYKSNRKANNTDEDGQAIDGIDIALKLEEFKITPAQYHLARIQAGDKFDPEFYRSDLIAELKTIVAFQSKFYPQIFDDKFLPLIENKSAKVVKIIFSKNYGVEAMEFKGKERKLETLKIRVDALSQKLELDQLACAIASISGQIASSSGYLGAISDRSKVLYTQKLTVGQYLMQRLQSDPNVPLKNLVFYRQNYFEEFNTIWDCQASFHNELTPELKKSVAGIIFMQRPLKSQKGNVGYCEFESHEIEIMVDGKKKKCMTGSKVCPKSSPLFQEFKIWQLINTIKVTDMTTGEIRSLEADERERLFQELNIRGELKKSSALKCLFAKPKQWEMNYDKLDGNRTQSALFDAYQKIIIASGNDGFDAFKMSAKDAVNAVKEIFAALGFHTDFVEFESGADGNAMKAGVNYKLWHLLYSYEGDNSNSGNEKLIGKLMTEYHMEREYAKILAGVTFPDEYSSLSAKVILKILPYLRQGLVYSEACESAGYRHSKNSLTREEINSKILVDHLENIPKNTLRNPVVEKILNQMINVVNSLVDTYGRIDEVRIELARELKKNAEERDRMNKANQETQKNNENYRKTLKTKFNIQNPSSNDILRYRLYLGLAKNGFKTLYSNTYLREEDLFTNKFDIEHIIPKARLFNDSFSNKTLESREINIEKSNDTAFDFVTRKYGEENAVLFRKRVDDLFKSGAISKTKHDNLLMKLSEIPDNFLNRDLAESQYIARKAHEILGTMFRTVVATTGSVTARLREDWQLVDVMQELNIPKFEKINRVHSETDRNGNTRKVIDDWSKRNDHRHHAMDAITIAFTKPAYIQYLNNLNARDDKFGEIYQIQTRYLERNDNGKLRFVPPVRPAALFRKMAEKQLSEILISIKAKNKVLTRNVNKTKVPDSREVRRTVQFTPRGELHQATIYGIRKHYVTSIVSVGGKMTMDVIAKVANKKYREALACRLMEFGNDPKMAFTGKNSLEKKPLYFNSFDTVPTKVKIVDVVNQYTKCKAVDGTLNVSKVVDAEVRRTLENRIQEFDGNQEKAFSNLDENPIRMKNGKVIKRVVVGEDLKSVVALHDKKDNAGNLVLNSQGKTEPADFVTLGNNHHVAIFEDADGNWQEHVVTFHEAVMRTLQHLPAVDTQYNAHLGWKFQFSMKKNEYFVFPNEETQFDPQTIDLTDPKNYARISPNLFRVQKLTSKDYYFRHHLETNVEDVKDLKGITWKRIRTENGLKKIAKIRINHIGEIVSVGDYL